MTLQSIFESYQAYWPAVFMFLPIGRYIQVLIYERMWNDEMDGLRRPSLWEAAQITFITWDVLFVQLLIAGLMIAGILWIAPFFTDQII